MYADHSLRLAQEIVTKNFFLRLLRQKGKGGGKLRMIQNGGLAAGGKKIFFKLLRLGKLDKLFTHQIIKGNFPFPPPAQLQDFIYGCVTNDYLGIFSGKKELRVKIAPRRKIFAEIRPKQAAAIRVVSARGNLRLT